MIRAGAIRNMTRHTLLICVSLLAALCAHPAAYAEKYKIDDAIPPGATGKVLPLQGKVTDLKGVSSAMAGKVDALGAALKDLGARTTETEIQIELSSDVLFDFDKSDLRPVAIPSLLKVVTVMQSLSSLCLHDRRSYRRQGRQRVQPEAFRAAGEFREDVAGRDTARPTR